MNRFQPTQQSRNITGEISPLLCGCSKKKTAEFQIGVLRMEA
jgi:hypothetical protein